MYTEHGDSGSTRLLKRNERDYGVPGLDLSDGQSKRIKCVDKHHPVHTLTHSLFLPSNTLASHCTKVAAVWLPSKST